MINVPIALVIDLNEVLNWFKYNMSKSIVSSLGVHLILVVIHTTSLYPWCFDFLNPLDV
jgi:hypothetical protein